jgi:hypothetical protein
MGHDDLRNRLVAVTLEWEALLGVAPRITSAVSEFDAAMLVGHTPASYGGDRAGKTAVARGCDFRHGGVRYQVKANRPSGKPGSKVTLVGKARNYEWDRLVWILYDKTYTLKEAWIWDVADYRSRFDGKRRLSPDDMRLGRRLR